MHLFPHSPTPREPVVKLLRAQYWVQRGDFREDWSSQMGAFLERVGLDIGPKDQRGRLGRANWGNSRIRRNSSAGVGKSHLCRTE